MTRPNRAFDFETSSMSVDLPFSIIRECLSISHPGAGPRIPNHVAVPTRFWPRSAACGLPCHLGQMECYRLRKLGSQGTMTSRDQRLEHVRRVGLSAGERHSTQRVKGG